MVERKISHKDVEDTITNGINLVEADHIRAIHEVEKDRFITVIYLDQRQNRVILTVYESNLTDIQIYRRMKK